MQAATIDTDASFPAAIQYIEDGDALNTGNHLINAQDCADGIGYLKGTGPTLTGTKRYQLASRSITRVQCYGAQALAAAWLPDGTVGGMGKWLQQGTTATLPLAWRLRIPHGATLGTVTATLQGAPAHGGVIGTPPQIQAGRRRASTGVYSSIGAVSTDTGVVAPYELLHTLSTPALAHVVDRSDYEYFLTIFTEGGANAVAGLAVFSVSATWTQTEQDED